MGSNRGVIGGLVVIIATHALMLYSSIAMSDIIWRPTKEFLETSNIARFMRKHSIKSYGELIRRSTSDIEWFWNAALEDIGIEWYRPYDKLLDMSAGFPWAKWFVGGKINIVHNCIDRHLAAHGNDTAVIWEGDDGSTRTLTYLELSDLVSRLANVLKDNGVKKGDAVGIYMPMVPEIAAALFASLKIGAVPVPIFSGFGADALAVRLADAEAKVLLTADGARRRGKIIPLKSIVDEAAAKVSSLSHLIILKHAGNPIDFNPKRDIWWHDALKNASCNCPTEKLDAEDRSLIIYTSGTTGKPKGTVHTHAGALAQTAKELCYAFNAKPHEPFFWLTDIGWMMGPWEMIGVAALGGTFVIFEGAPDWPDAGRLWKMIERIGITTLGISPTAIRVLMRAGNEWPARFDLSSLKILGSTGEPWDPVSYKWYFEKIGFGKCPVINISGGTEIIGCLLSCLPIAPLKPCTLGGPALGMDVDVFDDDGKPVRGHVGHLVCKKPAPSMTKGFLKDNERYLETYFSRWPDIWYHGDWANIDEDGFWFLHGRSDDTIKIGGKRVGPAEIEALLIEHPQVSEAAAIGVPDEIKGEAIVCFVVLKTKAEPNDKLREDLLSRVANGLGKALKPKTVLFVKALPKTRSAKIIRGVIRRIYLGEPEGDLSSVENLQAIKEIKMPD